MLKWAGSKSVIKDRIVELMPYREGDNAEYVYYEPFLGSGAIFYQLKPRNAVLSDTCSDLVDFHFSLAKHFDLLIQQIEAYEKIGTDQKAYYFVRSLDRSKDWKDSPVWVKAARLFYLQKLCFNGLFRINKSGFYNTSYCKSSKRKVLTSETIKALKEQSETIKACKFNLNKQDFAEAVRGAKKDDLVYFDPPYYGSYSSYSVHGFNAEDNLRLKKLVDQLSEKKVFCLISNLDCEEIRDLYHEYRFLEVAVQANISGKTASRGKRSELMICNYRLN